MEGSDTVPAAPELINGSDRYKIERVFNPYPITAVADRWFKTRRQWRQEIQNYLHTTQCNLSGKWKVVSSEEKDSTSQSVIAIGLVKPSESDLRYGSKSNVIVKIGFTPKEKIDNSLYVERDIYKNVLYTLIAAKHTPHVMAYLGSSDCDWIQAYERFFEAPRPNRSCKDYDMKTYKQRIADYMYKFRHKMPVLTVELIMSLLVKDCQLSAADTRDLVGFIAKVKEKIQSSQWASFRKSIAQRENTIESKKLRKEIDKVIQHTSHNAKLTLLYSELSDGIKLVDWMTANRTTNDVLEVMFQVFYTLLCFYNICLQHNDLHFGNIFVEELPAPVNLYYKTSSNQYVRLTTKYMIKIYDFDRGSSPHVQRNIFIDYFFCKKHGQCNAPRSKVDIFNFLSSLYTYISYLNINSIKPFLYSVVNKWFITYPEVFEGMILTELLPNRVVQFLRDNLQHVTDHSLPSIKKDLLSIRPSIRPEILHLYDFVVNNLDKVVPLNEYIDIVDTPHLLRKNLPDSILMPIPEIMNLFLSYTWVNPPFTIVNETEVPRDRELVFSLPAKLNKTLQTINPRKNEGNLLIDNIDLWFESLVVDAYTSRMEELKDIIAIWERDFDTNIIDQNYQILSDAVYTRYKDLGHPSLKTNMRFAAVILFNRTMRLLVNPVYVTLPNNLQNAVLERAGEYMTKFVSNIWALFSGVLPVTVQIIKYE